MLSVDDLKKLSPAWWGAIAGAVAAGATLLPNQRLLGGLGGGVAMFLAACAAKEAATGAEGLDDLDAAASFRPAPRVALGEPGLDELVPAANSSTMSAPSCASCGGSRGGVVGGGGIDLGGIRASLPNLRLA